MIEALEIFVASEPTARRHNTRKRCAKCDGSLKGAGTVCKACERAHFTGVDALRQLMGRQRIPCACGNVAGYVVDFRPVCSGCRTELRMADCNHRKDWKERRGICRECDNEAAPGRKHCPACLDKARMRATPSGRRYRTSLSHRLNVAERMKDIRAKTRAAGLCCNCYTVPAAEGRTRCESCLEKQRTRYRAMKAEGRKPARIGPTVSDLYGGRADLLTPRGDDGVGVDFESLSGITHVYVTKF